MNGRRPMVAVIGAAEATPEEEAFAEALGTALVDAGCRVVCGGRTGVMAAVCRGARASRAWTDGTTVALLKGTEPDDANPWVDIALPTGLGDARNRLVVLAGEVVVAIGGGSGTLSELALAWKADRPIVAATIGEGWSARLADQALDGRARPPIRGASTPGEAIDAVRACLSPRT